MFTLKCSYYHKSFEYLYQLIDDIILSGMDPNYEVVHNGVGTGTQASELIIP